MNKIINQIKKIPGEYYEGVERFKINDTVIIQADTTSSPRIIKLFRSTDDYYRCDFIHDNGIKNLKVSGSMWNKAEFIAGGQIIETIYPDIRDTFTCSLNCVLPSKYMGKSIKVYQKKEFNNDIIVSYNNISDEDNKKYLYNEIGYEFQLRQCNRYVLLAPETDITRTFTTNITGFYIKRNLSDLCPGLPISMIAIKTPTKCKRVFLTANFPTECDYIVPFIYDRKKDIWMLDNININPVKWTRVMMSSYLHIISKNNMAGKEIIIYIDNYNIARNYAGLYGLIYSY